MNRYSNPYETTQLIVNSSGIKIQYDYTASPTKSRTTFFPFRSECKRIIMIGDSYGNRVNADNKTYFDLIQANLGLSNSDFYHNNLSGAAFAHGTTTSKFLYLIQQLANTVTYRNSISDIIVVCGANDANYGYTATFNAILEFKSYCVGQYPNAQIHIFGCGLTFSNAICSILRNEIHPAFRSAGRFGIKFAENSQYCLMDSNYLENDICHPNATGVDVIAADCTNYIKFGRLDIFRTADLIYSEGTTGFNVTVDEPTSTGATYLHPEMDIKIIQNNGITSILDIIGNGSFRFMSNIVVQFQKDTYIRFDIPRRLLYDYMHTGYTTYKDGTLTLVNVKETIPIKGYIRAENSYYQICFITASASVNTDYVFTINWTPTLVL